MALLLIWMKVPLPQWDSFTLFGLLGCFTLATVCGGSDEGIAPFTSTRCCWGCLLGQSGVCSYLVMYGRSRALGHP